MSETQAVLASLLADVNQVDDSGYVWAFLGTANALEPVRRSAAIVAGDETSR